MINSERLNSSTIKSQLVDEVLNRIEEEKKSRRKKLEEQEKIMNSIQQKNLSEMVIKTLYKEYQGLKKKYSMRKFQILIRKPEDILRPQIYDQLFPNAKHRITDIFQKSMDITKAKDILVNGVQKAEEPVEHNNENGKGHPFLMKSLNENVYLYPKYEKQTAKSMTMFYKPQMSEFSQESLRKKASNKNNLSSSTNFSAPLFLVGEDPKVKFVFNSSKKEQKAIYLKKSILEKMVKQQISDNSKPFSHRRAHSLF